jgi:hydroxymethylbilane synthase
LSDKISFCFDPAQFIPAPAQGALAIQTRTDDTDTCSLIAAIDNEDNRTTTSVERRILTTMHCGCHAPVGAYAQIDGDKIEITAFISNVDGTNFIRRQALGHTVGAETLAESIANDLLASGGEKILASLEE